MSDKIREIEKLASSLTVQARELGRYFDDLHDKLEAIANMEDDAPIAGVDALVIAEGLVEDLWEERFEFWQGPMHTLVFLRG